MAESLIILVAVASMVGVFFLVLFIVLARRERRTLWKMPGHLGTRGVRAPRISWRVAYAVLVLVVVILAVISFLPWRSRK